MTATRHTEHVFEVENFCTDEECAAFIAQSERIGYNETSIISERGSKSVKTVRNNSRIVFVDEQLGARIWQKIEPFIKPIGNSEPVGLNEMFRFYKYEPGQAFKKHTDSSFIRNEVEASYYTLLIYLNDDFKGGDTRFDELVIKPKKGAALVFLHSLLHAGSTVKSGVKYVLRTDIMFRLKSAKTKPME